MSSLDVLDVRFERAVDNFCRSYLGLGKKMVMMVMQLRWGGE